MKKILYWLLAIVLYSGSVSAQTLMSDEEHRVMMNDFAVEVNDILTYNCPQGITVDQYKRGIVDGSYTLSQTMQNILIINYTQPLKDYGSLFATTKGLTADTDALKFFYSSFAPSTVVQNGKLVEGTAGLAATDMWTCALNTFGTDNCGSSVLVGDKYNMNTLATTCVNKLTSVAGNIGVLVMLNGFNHCQEVAIASRAITSPEFIEWFNAEAIVMNRITDLDSLGMLSQIPTNQWTTNNYIDASQICGFANTNEFTTFMTTQAIRLHNIVEIYHLSQIIDQGVFGETLLKYLVINPGEPIRIYPGISIPVEDFGTPCYRGKYKNGTCHLQRQYRDLLCAQEYDQGLADEVFSVAIFAPIDQKAAILAIVGLAHISSHYDECISSSMLTYCNCRD